MPGECGAMKEGYPVIQTAGPEEVADLAKLARSTFLDTYASYNTTEDMARYLAEHFTEERIAAIMAENGSLFLLMRLDGHWVGYAGMRAQDPGIPLSLDACWELERFYVIADFHGKGLARPLMTACVGEARARGYAGLWLGVWSENRRARRFYEKMGFIDEDEKTFVLGEDVQTDRVLVLPLS